MPQRTGQNVMFSPISEMTQVTSAYSHSTFGFGGSEQEPVSPCGHIRHLYTPSLILLILVYLFRSRSRDLTETLRYGLLAWGSKASLRVPTDVLTCDVLFVVQRGILMAINRRLEHEQLGIGRDRKHVHLL